MKLFILKTINFFLKQFGFSITKIRDQENQQIYLEFLQNLSLTQSSNFNTYQGDKQGYPDVNFIIFSKDRALQLHALLNSMYAHVNNPVKTFVLYYASNGMHEKAYKEIEEIFKKKGVNFIREQNFRHDLITLINSLKVTKLIFLVDDIIFTESLDLQDFTQFDTQRYVPALRFGKHLNFCYTQQKAQPLPKFMSPKTFKEEEKIIWNWHEGVLDWQYPLSVDGHLFSVHEIKNMLPLVQFKAPNSLEEAIQLFKPFYLKKYGVAYKKSKIVNIPCNKVQKENNNIAEEITVDFLLEKWQRGYQIDITSFKHFQNKSAHEYIPFTYIKRSNTL